MNKKRLPLPKGDKRLAFVSNRRELIRGLVLSSLAAPTFFQCASHAQDLPDERVAWVCPMHSDYTSPVAGVCPLCGMTLVEATPFDVRDYRLEFHSTPPAVRAGEKATLFFKVYRPGTGEPVTSYYWVHTKQWHQFVISQDMEFFEHIHPVMAPDGTWSIDVVLPKPGYYELLSDFFPSEGAAQFLAHSLVTDGYKDDLIAGGAHLVPETFPIKKTDGDLTISVSLDPPSFVAGLNCRMNFYLTDSATGEPVTDLQTYLGAFGHALMMSEDMVDYVHVHPLNILIGSQEDGAPPIFLLPPDADLEKVRGGPDVTLEALLPRPGKYRVWMQMQRHDILHTFALTFSVVPPSDRVLP